MKNKFSRDEIFVIKACKGHFGRFNGYEDAEKVIQKLIYAHPNRISPLQMIKLLRGILLKSQEWTAQSWENKTQFLIAEADKRSFGFGEEKPFMEKFLYQHFAQVAHLKVFDGTKNLIDLDITSEEELKINEALKTIEG